MNKKIRKLVLLIIITLFMTGCNIHLHHFTDQYIAPTCDELGYTLHTCSCGAQTKSNFVKALGHQYSEWDILKEATEEEAGQKQRTCSVCNKVESQEIEKLPHNHQYTVTIVDVTCTQQGYTLYTCRCGDSKKQDLVSATGHKFSEWTTIKEATEEETGLKQRTCSVCNESEYLDISKLPHVHDYQKTVIPATCTEEGYTINICRCNDYYKSDIKQPLNHNYSDWVIILQPTETTQGLKEKTCSNCNDKIGEIIPVIDHIHQYTQSVVKPMCLTQGYTLYTCTCGFIYKDDYVNAKGHSYGEWKITEEATEENTGLKEKKCKDCNDVITEVIPKTNHVHSYNSQVYAPTCTDDGYTLYICRCGDSYKNNITAATKHDTLTKVIKKATIHVAGSIEYTCSKCSYQETKEISYFACFHEYEVTEQYLQSDLAPGLTIYSCNFCDHRYADLIEANNPITQTNMAISQYSLLAGEKSLIKAKENFELAILRNEEHLFIYPYMELNQYKTVRAFTLELIKNCKDDTEKAKVIYTWVVNNLDYDLDAMNYQIYDTYVTKKAVCFGYVSLLHDMLSAAGIMSSYVSGYTSYSSLTYNDIYKYTRNDNCHAWLYAYINGKVVIMDPTWADGYLGLEYGFNMNINSMYKTHMVMAIEDIRVIPDEVDYRLYSNIYYTVGNYTFLMNNGKADLKATSLPRYHEIHRNSSKVIIYTFNNNKLSIHNENELLGCVVKNGFFCSAFFEKEDINSWSYSLCNGISVKALDIINYVNFLNSDFGYNVSLNIPEDLQKILN